MRPDGSNKRRLTRRADGGFDWAPDSSAIVFSRSDRNLAFDLYVVRIRGGERTRLNNSPGNESQPRWSPDGLNIAFVRTPEGSPSQPDIFVIDTSGENERRLTSQGGTSTDWSPDATRLAFTTDRDADPADFPSGASLPHELYVVDVASGTETRLTDTLDGSEDDPQWSLDGSTIAYTLWFDDDISSEDAEIYSIRADGSGVQQLTDTGRFRYDFRPTWSPRGAFVVYEVQRGQRAIKTDIFVMRADGSEHKNITADYRLPAINPDWRGLP